MFWQQDEECATQEGEVCQCVGSTGSGVILAPAGIAAPVVANFDASPMAADEAMPLRGRALVGQLAGKIGAGVGGGGGCLGARDMATHHDQTAGVGEADGIGLDGEGVQGAAFASAMPFGGLDKKGVWGSASSAWACASSTG